MRIRITGLPMLAMACAALFSAAALAQEATARESGAGDSGPATRAVAPAAGGIPYFKIGNTAGFPGTGSCNAPAHYGRMIFNSSTGELYLCVASGWVVK